MLTIRMQRTGRSGHAQYRVIVQDSRFSPTSGRVVAYLGSYNPHTKEAILDAEKASGYLSKGAQPSERVARLLKAQGVKMPDWVASPAKKEKSIRNIEKLRRNRPPEAEAKEPEAAPAEPEAVEAPSEVSETPVEEVAAEEVSVPVETPAEPEVEAPAEPATAEAPIGSEEPATKDK